MQGNHPLSRYLAAGALSGVLCWASGYVLPDGSLVSRSCPGIILGLTLAGLGHFLGVFPRHHRVVSALLLVVFTVAGWYLSVDIGFFNGEPLPYVVAGSIGGFCVSLGVVLAWRLERRGSLLVAVVTAAGALGGLLFRITTGLAESITDDMWVLMLFVEWQLVLMTGLWFAMVRIEAASRDSKM